MDVLLFCLVTESGPHINCLTTSWLTPLAFYGEACQECGIRISNSCFTCPYYFFFWGLKGCFQLCRPCKWCLCTEEMTELNHYRQLQQCIGHLCYHSKPCLHIHNVQRGGNVLDWVEELQQPHSCVPYYQSYKVHFLFEKLKLLGVEQCPIISPLDPGLHMSSGTTLQWCKMSSTHQTILWNPSYNISILSVNISSLYFSPCGATRYQKLPHSKMNVVRSLSCSEASVIAIPIV